MKTVFDGNAYHIMGGISRTMANNAEIWWFLCSWSEQASYLTNSPYVGDLKRYGAHVVSL